MIVDSETVEPLTPMRCEQLRYRPHLAQFVGEQITVIGPRPRALERAAVGQEADWFVAEVPARSTATSRRSS